MQRGTFFIFFGLTLVIIGIVGLKMTDINLFWLAIAGGAAMGSHGGISVSKRARV